MSSHIFIKCTFWLIEGLTTTLFEVWIRLLVSFFHFLYIIIVMIKFNAVKSMTTENLSSHHTYMSNKSMVETNCPFIGRVTFTKRKPHLLKPCVLVKRCLCAVLLTTLWGQHMNHNKLLAWRCSCGGVLKAPQSTPLMGPSPDHLLALALAQVKRIKS